MKINLSLLSELLMNMDLIEIKKGGKYKVVSNSGREEPMETTGEFVGYTLLGEEGAVCFRIKGEEDKSILRLIPVSGLIAIEFGDDELMAAKKKVDDSEKTTYFN
ncbi:MAG: hypothetical protein M1393_06630 [Candidatus Thermoplasmatota archaeon]|nr:hypothetical protein [Candidatus Thermoplasmatota archaeon]MCL6090695.1 hypothetical protein [Candidatus Thermoplasmatota archaeon]MDA8143811.1 hypothetical protein [Thermoplasmatales archaeon]